MFFEVNVYGATCKTCEKPIIKQDFIYGKFYMKISSTGDLMSSTGYLDLYHKGCVPKA